MIYELYITDPIAGLATSWGWYGSLWIVWLLCLVTDLFTGIVVACKTNKWSPKVTLAGVWRKLGNIAIVLITAVLDFFLKQIINDMHWLPFSYTAFLSPIVLVWYILTEISSILENIEQLGATPPPFLMRWIIALQKRVRQAGNIIAPPDRDE